MTAPTVCGPREGRGQAHGVRRTGDRLLRAEPAALVDPDRQRRHHHERREQGDRHVERDDDAEVAQQWERRADQDREAADRGDRRGEERPTGPARRHVGRLSRRQASLSLLEISTEDQHGELRTAGDHERAADGGQRAQGEPEQTRPRARRPRRRAAPAPSASNARDRLRNRSTRNRPARLKAR